MGGEGSGFGGEFGLVVLTLPPPNKLPVALQPPLAEEAVDEGAGGAVDLFSGAGVAEGAGEGADRVVAGDPGAADGGEEAVLERIAGQFGDGAEGEGVFAGLAGEDAAADGGEEIGREHLPDVGTETAIAEDGREFLQGCVAVAPPTVVEQFADRAEHLGPIDLVDRRRRIGFLGGGLGRFWRRGFRRGGGDGPLWRGGDRDGSGGAGGGSVGRGALNGFRCVRFGHIERHLSGEEFREKEVAGLAEVADRRIQSAYLVFNWLNKISELIQIV